MTLTIEEGREAVALARETLDSHVRKEKVPKHTWTRGPFSEERGVFVTLNLTDPMKERLRGCIGFPYPVKKLGTAIQEATQAAASVDPRFPPVQRGELDAIVVEVSVLTVPAPLKPARPLDLPSMVRIGVDGLIASASGRSGLLLPQVATEFGMGSEEFLSQVCLKAGLLPDAWLEAGTEIQVFQSEVFEEPRPRGEAVRVELSGR